MNLLMRVTTRKRSSENWGKIHAFVRASLWLALALSQPPRLLLIIQQCVGLQIVHVTNFLSHFSSYFLTVGEVFPRRFEN